MNLNLNDFPKFKKAQPAIIFFAGLCAFGWQVFAEDVDRPYLLAVIAGMLGLPFVIMADKARLAQSDRKEDEDEPSSKDSK